MVWGPWCKQWKDKVQSHIEYSIRFYNFLFEHLPVKRLKKQLNVGKAALEAGKTVAVDAGKKLIDKAMQPKKKVEDIISKYTANQTKGSAVAIQDLVKKLNRSGAGLKEI